MTITFAPPFRRTKIQFPQKMWCAGGPADDIEPLPSPDPAVIDLHNPFTFALAVRTTGTTEVVVEAELAGTEGLAVHPEITGRNYFTLSHIHSGCALCHVPYSQTVYARDRCLDIAAELDLAIDWTLDIATIADNSAVYEMICMLPNSRTYFTSSSVR